MSATLLAKMKNPTSVEHVELSSSGKDGELYDYDEAQTMDDVMPKYGLGWLRVSHLRKLNLLMLLCMFSSCNSGYDGSMLNGLQSMPNWVVTMGHPKGQHLGGISNAQMFGTIGCWPIAPYLCDRFGRKLPIALGCCIIIVGAAVQAAAHGYTEFVAGRVVMGFGIGFCTQASPLLLTESVYPEHRHIMTAIYNTLWPLGAIVAAWLTLGTSYIQNSSWSWRIPCVCQGMFPLMQLLLIYFVPESPRYLIDQGRHKQAREILVKYHAGGDDSSPLVNFEMAEISSAIELEKAMSGASYMEFIKTKANRYRLFLLCIVPCNMQLSGNGLLSYYLPLVLDSIGITDSHHQLYLNGGGHIWSFIVDLVSSSLVERAGRRRLFLISLGGMCITFSVWTILAAVGNHQTPAFANKNLANGVVAMIFIFPMFYGTAMQGLPILYFTEILPYHLRAKGLNITNIVTTLTLIYNGFVNPVALGAIGWKYYIVWDCALAMWFTIAYFTYPETKGHTLETVGEVFGEDTVRVSANLGVEIGREKTVDDV